ncbi:MAG: carbamoyltransferase C-terminal domain-containing protein [Alphaproteobacteria bacterium]|nr:carbamoyltransferase C-terminal domain-containing protein [Alphaproteobacteria bacterium]
MIVLGVHGGHNASAALMKDGRIFGMVQEERLTGRKNQTGFPKKAIDRLVSAHLDNKVSKIDAIACASLVGSVYWTALDHYAEFGVEDYVQEMHDYWRPHFYGDQPGGTERVWTDDYWHERYLAGKKLNPDHNHDFSFLERLKGAEALRYFNEVERKEVFRRHFGWTDEVQFVEHHACHAQWAFWGASLTPAQRAEALIITADSRGDHSNWSVWTSEPDGTLTRLTSGLDNAVARLYKFTTLILGMRPNEHEYKVMGLASYSRSRKHIEAAERVFFEALDFRDGRFVSDRPLKDSYFDLKARLEGHRFDNIAAALQNWCTEVTCRWARDWLKETGRRGLCFSGGLSMNIKTNGELLALPDLDWLSVPASGGDESLAAGACFAVETPEVLHPIEHVYLGETAARGDEDWQTALSRDGCDPSDYDVMSNIDATQAARLLAADLIVARCVGLAEFGARALGNRSILANPANPANLKTINDAIKQRDFWMPFTPSILAEHADRYLVNPKACVSPFMTIGFPTKPERRHEVIAALHPGDFSARPQFVLRETNPDYWGLIDAFYRITGIPALLNTSLNLHGEPMNYSVEDAIRTLSLSGLDFLLLPGDRLLYKRAATNRLHAALADDPIIVQAGAHS